MERHVAFRAIEVVGLEQLVDVWGRRFRCDF
jgi:hypothetical protein